MLLINIVFRGSFSSSFKITFLETRKTHLLENSSPYLYIEKRAVVGRGGISVVWEFFLVSFLLFCFCFGFGILLGFLRFGFWGFFLVCVCVFVLF